MKPSRLSTKGDQAMTYRTDKELIEFLRKELRYAAAHFDDIGRPNTAKRCLTAAETQVTPSVDIGDLVVSVFDKTPGPDVPKIADLDEETRAAYDAAIKMDLPSRCPECGGKVDSVEGQDGWHIACLDAVAASCDVSD